jgi:Mn2+/Fe2+ NRAMP family transporter
MGDFANAFWLKSLSWGTALLIAVLNLWLLVRLLHP